MLGRLLVFGTNPIYPIKSVISRLNSITISYQSIHGSRIMSGTGRAAAASVRYRVMRIRVMNPFYTFFFDCPTTSGIHDWFINKYFNILTRVPDTELSSRRKLFFFLGNLNNRGTYNELEHLMGLLVQFLIWDMKLNKKLLTGLTLDIDFRFFLTSCFRNCYRLSELKRGLPRDQQITLSWTD
jgi:hypothetical protein